MDLGYVGGIWRGFDPEENGTGERVNLVAEWVSRLACYISATRTLDTRYGRAFMSRNRGASTKDVFSPVDPP